MCTGRVRHAGGTRIARRLLAAVAALALALLLLTGWALESGGVAVVETRRADGGLRRTHVWYAEEDGDLWLEAGTPENPWFRDVRRDPELTLRTEGRSGRFLARIVEGASGHEHIRSLLREKYGIRDRFVGLLVDTRRSVAVRLLPVGATGAVHDAGVSGPAR
jgi:hypothetical protein